MLETDSRIILLFSSSSPENALARSCFLDPSLSPSLPPTFDNNGVEWRIRMMIDGREFDCINPDCALASVAHISCTRKIFTGRVVSRRRSMTRRMLLGRRYVVDPW